WTAGCGLAGVTGRAHGGHRRNHRSSKAFDLRGGHVAATGTSVWLRIGLGWMPPAEFWFSWPPPGGPMSAWNYH
ncbi:hypothetical protein, partial [Mycobacterium tuberculosis]|uniref:hypothetical protein n=1 Tax=Mycobacterium tuberculosis TaxID=1773 RepID=UPI001AE081BA